MPLILWWPTVDGRAITHARAAEGAAWAQVHRPSRPSGRAWNAAAPTAFEVWTRRVRTPSAAVSHPSDLFGDNVGFLTAEMSLDGVSVDVRLTFASRFWLVMFEMNQSHVRRSYYEICIVRSLSLSY